MKRIVRIIWLVTVLFLSPLIASSDEMGTKPYALKIKLKPRVVKSRIYVKPKIPSDITFRTTPVLFKIDVNIDLEEFPNFKLESEFKNRTSDKLFIYLGIDYTGDNIIDDCLKFENTSVGACNIFGLAKNRWSKFDKFVLKKISLLILPKDKKENEKEKAEAGIYRIKNISLYNDNSLVVVEKKHQRSQLKFQEVNAKCTIIERDDTIDISVYVEDEPVEKNYKKERTGQIKILVPLEIKDFSYFSFNYELENTEFQDIKLDVLINKCGKRETIGVPTSRYAKLRETKKIEVYLRGIIPQGCEVEGLVIILEQKEQEGNLSQKDRWHLFRLANLQLYEKFPYPLKTEQKKEKFLSLLPRANFPLVKIDDEAFHLNDFVNSEDFKYSGKNILIKKLVFTKGEHKYEKLGNETLDVEWVILEPVKEAGKGKEEPEITFKKINPTKYLVKVKGAKTPFWLVFSEGFHKQWRLYNKVKVEEDGVFKEIVADYPKLKVKEAKHLMKFIPKDIKYLFKEPLDAQHQLVNGYANGWYVEPNKLGLGEDFTLVIYFWPQTLFYLGLGISGATLLFCIGYLLWKRRR